MFCSKDPDIDFSNSDSFNCTSPLTICSQPDSIGVFGDDDCDNGGISNLLECINGTDFKVGDDDCSAAIRGNIDICLLIQVDQNDVSKGYLDNHVLSQVDCDGGGLTNFEECVNGFNPLKGNDFDEQNGRINDEDIERYLKKINFIDQNLILTDTIGTVGLIDSMEIIKTESGLVYMIETLGQGELPAAEDSLEYNLSASYLEDCILQPVSEINGEIIILRDFIFGISEGLSQFPAGSKGKLIMPSRLAYNEKAFEGIPSYSILVVDVELVRIL